MALDHKASNQKFHPMQLYDIVTTSRSVRETNARSDKIRHLAACLRRVEPDDIETAVALLSGEPRQGRIGLGPAIGIDAAFAYALVFAAVLMLPETRGARLTAQA